MQWPWPGNVRELRNVIERACLLCEGHLLTEGDLARSLSERPWRRSCRSPMESRAGPPPSSDEVRAALDSAGGNKSLAARRLGISRRALYRLIDKYGELRGDTKLTSSSAPSAENSARIGITAIASDR